MILDVHTHHANRSNAIINAHYSDFKADDGLFYSVGIHPWDVHKIDSTKDVASVYTLAEQHSQIIAIGECGLDRFAEANDVDQYNVFYKLITVSESVRKPLIIHCVKRYNMIAYLHRDRSPKQAWILHGFSANSNVLSPLLSIPGIYFSIGEKFNPEAVKLIPAERLLIETDESTLPIEEIANRVAVARGETTESIILSATQNTNRIFFPMV